VTSWQSGWAGSEFQTVTEACSELRSRKAFPAVHTSVDDLGTSPWPRAEVAHSLMAAAGNE